MKTNFLAGAIGLALVCAPQPGQMLLGCDRCDQTSHKRCACCDDRGILNLLDGFMGQLEDSGRRNSKSTGCDHCKTGCDVAGKTANRGCNCGCGTRSSQSGARLLPPTVRQPTVLPPEAAYGAPGYYTSPQPQPLPELNRNLQPTPAPRVMPVPPPAAVPDSQVDPFRDEEARRIRKVPARTIQYQQQSGAAQDRPRSAIPIRSANPVRPYGAEFDPQASSGIRFHLSDDYSSPEMLAVDSSLPRNQPRMAVDRAVRTASALITSAGSPLRAEPMAMDAEPSTVQSSPIVPDASTPALPIYHNPLR